MASCFFTSPVCLLPSEFNRRVPFRAALPEMFTQEPASRTSSLVPWWPEQPAHVLRAKSIRGERNGNCKPRSSHAFFLSKQHEEPATRAGKGETGATTTSDPF